MVPGKTCTECLPGFVKDGDACVSVVEKEAAKLKNKAMAICEAIPKAIDTAGDVIMATLFPSDATALGNMLAVRAFPSSKSRRMFTAPLWTIYWLLHTSQVHCSARILDCLRIQVTKVTNITKD